MTKQELSAAMRRIADAVDRLESAGDIASRRVMLSEDQAVGAAQMLCLIRDLITVSSNEVFPKGDLLVLLEVLSRDQDIFPLGLGVQFWNMDVGEDES